MYCNVSHKPAGSPPFLPKHTFLPTCRLRGEDAIHWLAVGAETYWNRLGDLNVSVGEELGDVGTGIDRSVGCTAHTAFRGYPTAYIAIHRPIILFYSYRLQLPGS